MSEACVGCEDEEILSDHFDRAVDNSAWDASAAMSNCAGSDKPAACYRAICAGRKAGDPDQQVSWALPHHKAPGGPANMAACRNGLARLSQTQGLENTSAAKSHLQAHLAEQQSSRLPKESLIRAMYPALEIRAADGGQEIMHGHFSVFNDWTEIHGREGHFMERVAPGSFTKAFRDEYRSGIRVLFQHGMDPNLGNQILGLPEVLEEDDVGAHFEVPLFDGVPPLIRSGLKARAYGASFRFRVTREDLNNDPDESPTNPDRLPERTIREVELFEFGPVTFPAYEGTTVGVRSLTDHFAFLQLVNSDPQRLLELVDFARRFEIPQNGEDAPPTPDAGASHLGQGRSVPVTKNYLTREVPSWKLMGSPR